MPALTVATYNVWGGGEPWRYMAERGVVRGAAPGSPATTLRPPEGVWSRRRRLLAEILRWAGADVVGLQEALADPPMAEQLADDLDCHAESAGGLAVLARHPILGSAYLVLPSPPVAEMQQGALLADVAAPDGPVEVASLHLTPRSEAARLAALRELLRALGDRRPLVVGDFNAPPDSPTLRLMAEAGWRDAWACVHPSDPGATMPSHAPVTRIDYVLLPAGAEALAVSRLGELPDAEGFFASDHLGVVTSVRLPAPGHSRPPPRGSSAA